MRISGRWRSSSRAASRPVAARHRDVDHGEVDRLAQAALDGLDPVAGLGHDGQVGLGLEHHPQPAAHDGVVVGEQDPGRQWDGHRSSLTSVPRSGSARTRRRPPASSARSRIPPTPPSVAAGVELRDPHPVVGHAQHDRAVLLFELDLRGAGAGVAGDVGQALLGHAIDGEILVGAQHRQVRRQRVPHAQPREAVGERRQRAAQPELLQRARAAGRARSRAPARHRRAPPPGPRRGPPLGRRARAGGSPPRRGRRRSASGRPGRAARGRRAARSASVAASARRALPWRSASRRSSISLNASASSPTSAAGLLITTRRPGSCGSTRRIVPVRRSSGTKIRRSSSTLSPITSSGAGDQHLDLGRRRRRADARRADREHDDGADHQYRIDEHDAPEQRHALPVWSRAPRFRSGRAPQSGGGDDHHGRRARLQERRGRRPGA